YKVTGEWQDAQDWENFLTYNIAVTPGAPPVPMREDALGENSIDWRSRVIRGSGTLAYYLGNSRLELSGGASETDGVGQTNVGRNQLRGWQYNFLQARYTTPNWFFNLYRTQSQSGESFAINRYADALARNPTLSSDSLRMLSDWPSDGRMYAAEVQNNFSLPALLNTEVVWGAQYRRDVVSSDRQWLSDRLTGEDIEIGQVGVYGQVETPIIPALNLVMAARFDDHENYDAQFSPKVGLVFKPAEDQALRITYNRAFKSPTTLQTNFHIPDWTAFIAIFGNREGFTVRNNATGTGDGTTYTPLVPEENQTWEAGYKGVLANRLFIDVAGYYSRYENFLSPLVVIANPFPSATNPNPTFAYDAKGQLIRNEAGLTPVMLTYFNLGRATIYGTDAGINYFVTPKISLNSTVSLLQVDTVEVPAGREEATAINAPDTKWTLGANFNEIGRLAEGFFFGGLTARHVNSYYFRSGINMGVIPTFSTLDLNAGYRLPRWNTSFNVGVSNLFTCSQKDDAAFTYAPTDPLRRSPTNKERECGFGVKHHEMINMPAIGTMVFVGARYHLQ
ncbi:MAG TPA: TonB-dependent receptor, partial [Chloroflexota bacterium]|nr:TonB-dependent receptor [Chloroflexota bacterium]